MKVLLASLGQLKTFSQAWEISLVSLNQRTNVLIDVFRAFGSGAGGRGLFRQFNELILDNADNFKKFGEAFGSVIGALFDQLKSGQGSFFEKLPLISEVLDKVATRVIPRCSICLTQFFLFLINFLQFLTGWLKR